MSGLVTILIVASISGAGLITGLLFAFSNFIMKALSDLPSDKGLRLASADVSDSNEIWLMYQKKWQRWNYVRRYIGVASVLLLTMGLGSIEP